MTAVTSQIEYQHDYRPTHSVQPAELIDAREAMLWAWKRQVEICDDYEEGRASQIQVIEATEAAQAADDYYRDLYAIYNAPATLVEWLEPVAALTDY